MKFITSLLLFLLLSSTVLAQSFSEFFLDKTLRIDYIWSGNTSSQHIVIDEISCNSGWAGRHNNLNWFPLAGDGELTMKDKTTQKVIYKTTFSSLFHEWLETPESTICSKGFEHTLLMPYPKNKVEITVKLFSLNKLSQVELTHIIDPCDILIRENKKTQNSYRYLIHNGTPEECIDIAILAEGYTVEEQEVFYQDATKAVQSIFQHEPFKSLQHKFNVVAVASPSKESGVSIPKQNKWINTAFNSHFDTFYSDRYLTTKRVKSIHDALNGIPYEHIIILANTEQYGGGGIFNSFTLTTSKHPAFAPVVVHEFGHSFAGLADEYFYEDEDIYTEENPLDVEPWEQNVTNLVDFDSKWESLLKPKTPIPTPIENSAQYPLGVYEGAKYRTHKMYRPAIDCRMKSNSADAFCPVCNNAIEKLILFYTQKEDLE